MNALRRQVDKYLTVNRDLLDGQDTALAVIHFLRDWKPLKRMLAATSTLDPRRLRKAAGEVRRLLEDSGGDS